MSLIVEDGTGKPDAESYCTLAYATARHAANGMSNWATLAQPDQEAALRRATQFMLQAYRQRWQGLRQHFTQALCWPRYGVTIDEYHYVAPDSVPADIQNACADLALKAAAGDLNADLLERVIRKKVGPIETEYDRYSPQSVRYRSIEMMLAPYLTGSGNMVRLARA